ncbi:hypothetical protein VitviT2T_003217 [Vitis vinifera]|uniref:Auxin-responsive protein SAUR66 n=1 Tax=Vitis vinifera TaxID=29760 RepID=A0ABY9BMF2_VITVI|nr:hypothetical protein VitviT2T_003217 [Vitis vinifera]
MYCVAVLLTLHAVPSEPLLKGPSLSMQHMVLHPTDPNTEKGVDADSCGTSSVADKGHFVVYSSDRRRFMIPLVYLNNEIFRELFQMSEEEFGIQSDGPIILPCDSVFMDYVISFIQRGIGKDLERALIMSMASSNCSSSSYFHQEQNNERLLLCVF